MGSVYQHVALFVWGDLRQDIDLLSSSVVKFFQFVAVVLG